MTHATSVRVVYEAPPNKLGRYDVEIYRDPVPVKRASAASTRFSSANDVGMSPPRASAASTRFSSANGGGWGGGGWWGPSNSWDDWGSSGLGGNGWGGKPQKSSRPKGKGGKGKGK